MKRTFLAVLCSCVCVGVLHANVIFQLGNHPQPGEVNVLTIKGETGKTVFGHTNTKPSVTVDFMSTETLLQNANGQAQVSGCAGTCLTPPFEPSPIDNITISLAGGLTYGDLIVDPHITNDCRTCGGGLTITVLAEKGGVTEPPFTFTIPLISKGMNFFTLHTTGGEGIISTSIGDATSNFSDVRQVRLSGISGVVPVPEPTTYAPLLAIVSWLSVKWRKGVLR